MATATTAALMGMECVVFMGEEDTKRQALNVYRMRLLGSEVIPVITGTGTLKDACSAAFREWTNRIHDTHYCLGSVMGPHPFPTMGKDQIIVINISGLADGAIVGSAIVKLIAQYGTDAVPHVRDYVKAMKQAITEL